MREELIPDNKAQGCPQLSSTTEFGCRPPLAVRNDRLCIARRLACFYTALLQTKQHHLSSLDELDELRVRFLTACQVPAYAVRVWSYSVGSRQRKRRLPPFPSVVYVNGVHPLYPLETAFAGGRQPHREAVCMRDWLTADVGGQ